MRYGSECTEALLGGRAARVYELGPEPDPDDTDCRSPSVVTWHDADMFYLIASDEMSADELVRIAHSSTLVVARVHAPPSLTGDARGFAQRGAACNRMGVLRPASGDERGDGTPGTEVLAGRVPVPSVTN